MAIYKNIVTKAAHVYALNGNTVEYELADVHDRIDNLNTNLSNYKTYVDQTYLKLAGGTITGNLTVNGSFTGTSATLSTGLTVGTSTLKDNKLKTTSIEATNGTIANINATSLTLDSTTIGNNTLSTTTINASGTITGTKLVGPLTGNASSATKLASARTLSASGHATGSATFDGSANTDIKLTLSDSGVSAGTYGPSTNVSGGSIVVPTITVDKYGRVTSMSTKTYTGPTLTNGSVPSSTKLTTARTLTIGNTGKAFDGSANVSWSISEIGAATAGHTHDLSGLINALSTGSSTPNDNDYFISQYVGGGTTTTTYHRRPLSALFSYIKGKLPTSSQTGSYADLSNKPTIGNGTITIKQAGVSKGTFTTNQTGNTTIELTDNNTTYNVATQSANGLESAADKKKLDGIATGAQVNQNAFSNITVGSTTIAADSATDTLTLVAGSNITLTPDANNDKVTITSKDTIYTHPSHTAKSSGLYKITVDSLGHVNAATAVTKNDITGLGISDTDTTYSTGTSTVSGLTKLYTGTGTATDGTMTQSALKTALDAKASSSHDHDSTYLKLTGGTVSGDLTISGTASICSCMSVYSDAVNIKGGLAIKSLQSSSFGRPIQVFDSLVPNSTNRLALGSSTSMYSAVYATTLYENGKTLSNYYLPLSGGTITKALTVNGQFSVGGLMNVTDTKISMDGNIEVTGAAAFNSSHVIGEYSFGAINSTVKGNYSFAAGYLATANSPKCIAIGTGTKAASENQLAIGRYNVEDTSSLIVIGNGTSDNKRSTLFTMNASGHCNLQWGALAEYPAISPSLSIKPGYLNSYPNDIQLVLTGTSTTTIGTTTIETNTINISALCMKRPGTVAIYDTIALRHIFHVYGKQPVLVGALGKYVIITTPLVATGSAYGVLADTILIDISAAGYASNSQTTLQYTYQGGIWATNIPNGSSHPYSPFSSVTCSTAASSNDATEGILTIVCTVVSNYSRSFNLSIEYTYGVTVVTTSDKLPS